MGDFVLRDLSVRQVSRVVMLEIQRAMTALAKGEKPPPVAPLLIEDEDNVACQNRGETEERKHA
jgi:hypothetical protein